MARKDLDPLGHCTDHPGWFVNILGWNEIVAITIHEFQGLRSQPVVAAGGHVPLGRARLTHLPTNILTLSSRGEGGPPKHMVQSCLRGAEKPHGTWGPVYLLFAPFISRVGLALSFRVSAWETEDYYMA